MYAGSLWTGPHAVNLALQSILTQQVCVFSTQGRDWNFFSTWQRDAFTPMFTFGVDDILGVSRYIEHRIDTCFRLRALVTKDAAKDRRLGVDE